MAEPVLLISNDPFLGASLEALGRGRVQVARLDPARRPAAWPGGPAATVVLDVTAGQRDAAYRWVRQHHPGPLVVLLKPGERDPDLRPDPARLVIRRPFRLADLVEVLQRPPAPVTPTVVPVPDPGPASRNLLQASAEQRMRRLGALSAPAAVPPPGRRAVRAAPPVAAGRSPGPGWPTAATRLDAPRRRRRRRRGGGILLRMLLGVLAALALAGAWLAFGLLEAREDLRVGASAVRTELTRAEAALGRGDPATARAAVQAAARNLDFADAVAGRRELRVAARLPVLSGGVSDTRHLLAAARNLTGAGERAVAVVTRLQSGRSAARRRGRFDLAAIGAAAGQAKGLVAELERARGELELVRGGRFAPGAGGTKRWAMARLDQAAARARPMVPTLEALPAFLGAAGPRTYLVALTNPAELRPAGGVPLALLEVVMDDGAVQVSTRGGEIERSMDSSSPHFPTAAQQLLGADQARGRQRPDGVVAIDPLAMRALLEATGPVAVPGYGRLDAANLVRRTIRDAYVRWPDRAERRRHHQALLRALVARFLSGPDLVATGRILGTAGARRNLQVYATDAGLQRVLARHRLDGALADADRDYLAVHTRNRNRSRVDFFQRRSIHQVVRLGPDGSAEVTRTITITNAVPAGEPFRPGAQTGDASGRAAAVLATSLPPGAAATSATLDGRPVSPATAGERGRPLLRVEVDLRPGQAATFTVGYRLEQAAARDGRTLRYRLGADPQAMVNPPALRVDVAAPPGMVIVPTPGWAVQAGTANLAVRFTEPLAATLDLRG